MKVISFITPHNTDICLQKSGTNPRSITAANDTRVNDQARRSDSDKMRATKRMLKAAETMLSPRVSRTKIRSRRAGTCTCSAGIVGPEETARKGERIEAGSVRIDSIGRPIRGSLLEERRNHQARARVKGSSAFVLLARRPGKQSK